MKVFKMIKLINSTNGKYGFFKNYHELCEYINNVERFKALDSGKIKWRFSRRKYETLSFVYYRIPKSFEEIFTAKEKEAFEKGLGLIEILQGDEKNPTQILFTSHLDTESLKRNWCHDYRLVHGYTVFDERINKHKKIENLE